MRVSKPRNRIVYFRLSEQEFSDLVQICEAEGERSVSDLIRNAVRKIVERSHNIETCYPEDLSLLSANVRALTQLVKELKRELRAREA